jgi:hypothetical protein
MAKTFENSDIAGARWGNPELYAAYHAHTHTLFIEYFSDEHLALRFDSHLKSIFIYWHYSNEESTKHPGKYKSSPMIAVRDIGDTPSNEKITIASFGYTVLDKTCSFLTLLELLEGYRLEGRFEREHFGVNLIRSAFHPVPGTGYGWLDRFSSQPQQSLTGFHDWVYDTGTWKIHGRSGFV